MGKDKTPTSRSDQSESAVAIAANATVVPKSVRRPRPTPSAALVSTLAQKRSAAVCFMGSNPGRRRPAVKTCSWHTYSRTSQNEHFSRSCQLSHFPAIGRRRRGYRCPKRLRPVAITCPTPAARALLMVTGTPNSPAGRRIVGQRKVLNGVGAGQCELHTFPICRVQNVRRRCISGHLEPRSSRTPRSESRWRR
jgi:hypothetical protein